MASQIPDHEIAGALATLQNLRDEDLQGLLEDGDKFESYVQNLDQVIINGN
jgi:hypothetical protein